MHREVGLLQTPFASSSPSTDTAAMQICVTTRTWLSSGCGLFAQELVAGLLQSGMAVTFIAPRAENPHYEKPQPGLKRLRPPRERRDDSHKAIRALYSLARVFGSAVSMLRARFSNRVFVVSIPEPLVFGVPMLALLRLTGARIIFVAHDPVPHAWRLPERWRALELWMHEACYRLAAEVVVLSEPGRAKIRESFPKVRTPISVIEHGIFVSGAPTALPGDGILLVFGALRRNKGVRESIEGAVAAHTAGVPVRLIIAGEAHNEDPDYWRACQALAQAHPDVVDLRIGYVPDDALARLIAECDAFLLPYSEFFSQSGVALLAASNARPVVASSVGGIGALIADGMPAATVSLPVTAQGVQAGIEDFFRTPADTWRTRAGAYRDETLQRRSWVSIAQTYRALAERIAA